MHAAQVNTQVTERDVAVFDAVIRNGLNPEPDIGEQMTWTDGLPPAVVSQTLRLCKQPADDLGCVPAAPAMWTRPYVFTHAEIEELTDVNAMTRTVHSNLIRTVPFERAFHGARTWHDLRAWVDHRKVPICVQFTAPAYIDETAIVYVQRLWDRRAFGWFVRLTADRGQWRVVTKKRLP